MNKDKKEIIKIIISIIAGLAGTIASSTTGIPVSLGAFVMAVYLFRRLFNRDPFEASEEELRSYVHKAIELENVYRRELEDLARVKKRIEKKEIVVHDIDSLDRRIKQVEEIIEIARAKKNVVETILMVRENMDIFKKLLGDKNFGKLVTDVEYLKNKVEEALKREGMEEIDLKEVTEYLKNAVSLIIREPEKYMEKTEIKEEGGTPKPEEKPTVNMLEELLNSGSVDQWVEFIKKAVHENTKIKLPPGRYQEKKGFKNLLKSLYIVDCDVDKLRKVFDDKVLIRFAEYLKALKEGKTIEVSVQSSDLVYMDDMLEKISDEVKEGMEGETKIRIYGFTAIGSEQVVTKRKVMKDQATGKAIKIVFERASQ